MQFVLYFAFKVFISKHATNQANNYIVRRFAQNYEAECRIGWGDNLEQKTVKLLASLIDFGSKQKPWLMLPYGVSGIR